MLSRLSLLSCFFISLVSSISFAIEFVEVHADKNTLQYIEGDRASITIIQKTKPVDQRQRIAFEAYFPDEQHAVRISNIGTIGYFLTEPLLVGSSRFTLKVYFEEDVFSPSVLLPKRNLVQTKIIELNTSPKQVAQSPVAILKGSPTNGDSPLAVFFDGSTSTDPNSLLLTYEFDFGDGSEPIRGPTSTASHVYVNAGQYQAKLTVTNSVGLSDTKFVTIRAIESSIPVDPVTVAPPVDPLTPAEMEEQVSFLYSGANPIQKNVDLDEIDPKRVSVFRGVILDENGNGVSGVKVSVSNEPQFGSTLSREDGAYDLAVNVGGFVNLQFEKVGFSLMQRKIQTQGQDYYAVPTVIMTQLDSKVTLVQMNTLAAHVAQASTVSDADGERTAAVLIPSQTTAKIQMPDGSLKDVPNLSIRATEVTVGENGQQKMPGILPPRSSYTYAVDLTSDEAIAMGGKGVLFSKPVAFYVDNFLNLPVGAAVPVGYYNPDTNAWQAQSDGIVIKILEIRDGKAVLAVTSNSPASQDDLTYFGITSEELEKLASTYPVGKELWRAQSTHFSALDLNFMRTGQNAVESADPIIDEPLSCPGGCQEGSVIDVSRQILMESIPLVGVPFDLTYSSYEAEGRSAKGSITMPLLKQDIPENLLRISVEVSVLGKSTVVEFKNLTPHLKYDFYWSGKDGYGRDVNSSSAQATVTIKYHYRDIYNIASYSKDTPTTFDTFNKNTTLTSIPGRGEYTVNKVVKTTVQKQSLRPGLAGRKTLGGWSIPLYHSLDISTGTVYFGNGSVQSLRDRAPQVSTVLGSDERGFSGDGGSVALAKFNSPLTYSMTPDGGYLVADSGNNRIRKVGSDGIVRTIIGNGQSGFNGDNLLALDTSISNPTAVAQDRAGNIYFCDTGNSRVRYMAPDGVVRTIAGPGSNRSRGKGAAIRSTDINAPDSLLIGSDGSIYIGESSSHRILRIQPNGAIETYVGTGVPGYSGDGGIASVAQINHPFIGGLDVAGALYFADRDNNVIRKVSPDGIISTVLGTGNPGDREISPIEMNKPMGVTVTPGGAIYVADTGNSAVRKLNIAGNYLNTFVGFMMGAGFNGDLNGPNDTKLNNPSAIIFGSDEALYIVDSGNNRIRRYGAIGPKIAHGEHYVPSSDGSEVYFFSSKGIHLRTQSGLTGAIKFKFNHDSSGRLISIADRDGNLTTLNYSGSKVESISSPYAQSSRLSYNSDGYLTSLTTELGRLYKLEYATGGLLNSFKTPGGKETRMSYDSAGRLISEVDHAGGIKRITRYSDSEIRYKSPRGYETTYDNNNELLNSSHEEPSGITRRFYGGLRDSVFGVSTNYHRSFYTEQFDPRFGATVKFADYFSEDVVGEDVGTYIFTDVSYPVLTNLFAYKKVVNSRHSSGLNTSMTFDSMQRTSTLITSVGRTSSTLFDERERVVERRNGDFAPLNYTYNEKGQLTRVQQADRVWVYSYNDAGLLETEIDPLNLATTRTYDTDSRLISITSADGKLTKFFYDSDSNLIGVKPPGRDVHAMSYNSLNLLTAYTPPQNNGNSIGYSYNADKEKTKFSRADGREVIYLMDPVKDLLSKIVQQEYTTRFGYSYDRLTSVENGQTGGVDNYIWLGNRIVGKTYSGRYPFELENKYNDRGVLTYKKIAGSQINIAYDMDGLLVSAGGLSVVRSNSSNVVVGFQQGIVSADIVHNIYGEPVSKTYKVNQTPLYSENYVRDLKGKIVKKTIQNSTSEIVYDYIYDLMGRLTQVSKNGVLNTSYSYDDQGNRIGFSDLTGSIVGVYDGQDRVVSYGTHVYTSLADGEISSVTDSSNAATTQYAYGSLGQIISVNLPNGKVVSYTVNGENQRFQKTVDGTATAYFAYDESGRLVADADANGITRNIYVYVTDGHSPDYIIRGGKEYFLVKDQLGSILMVVDSTDGSVVQQLEYDEFGVVLTDSNPGFQFMGFAGGLYDSDTRLVRFGARDYDPKVGRWMTKDPIGFKGGDGNLYGYVFQDPINHIDPSGLTCNMSQSSGVTICSDMHGNMCMVNNNGYSGAGAGQNNPAMENVPFQGPIPKGSYTVGAMVPTTPKGLKNALPLTPNPGTNTFGRDEFFIHGENANKPPGASSAGCPIIGPANRSLIPEGEIFNVGR